MSNSSKLTCITISLVLLLSLIEAGPLKYRNGREIRAPFKNPEIMVARGWGKRDVATGRTGIVFDDKNQLIRDDDLENGSIAIDWMAKELTTNPTLSRAILHRFIDTNKDGLISAKELMGTPFDNLNNNNNNNDFY